MKKIISGVFLLWSMVFATFGQLTSTSLQGRVSAVLADKKAMVGIAVYGTDGREILSVNAGDKFPLQSVFKFHIALAVLHHVDSGKLSIVQYLESTPRSLPQWL